MIPGDIFSEKAEKEREAFGVLYPDKETLPDRIKLITTTRGKAPTIKALFQAKVIFELLDAMDDMKEEIWDRMDVSTYFEEHAPSLSGRHAERAVDIARAAPKPSIEESWLDRIAGAFRR